MKLLSRFFRAPIFAAIAAVACKRPARLSPILNAHRSGRRALVSAANDEEPMLAAANTAEGGTVFEVQQGESFFVPYGEYPHAKGLQKFDKASAEAMAAAFNDTSVIGKLKKLFTKPQRPIFKGHPDVQGRPDSNPAAPAVGWVTGITAENDGATFAVKMNPAGSDALANGEFRFYSPHWLMRPVKGGMMPVELVSFGLTNNPKIPVPAIANDDTPPTPQLLNQLAEILGLPAGSKVEDVLAAVRKKYYEVSTWRELVCLLSLCENAGADLVLAAAKDLKMRAEKLAAAENDATTASTEREQLRTQLTEAQRLVTEAEGKLTAAANDLTTATTAREAAEASAKLHREARVDAALDGAIAGKTLTPGEREAKRTALLAAANDSDLATALQALGKAPAVIPGATSKTGNLGKKNSELAAAENDQAAQIRAVVSEEHAKVKAEFPNITPGRGYDMAVARARKANPLLFK